MHISKCIHRKNNARTPYLVIVQCFCIQCNHLPTHTHPPTHHHRQMHWIMWRVDVNVYKLYMCTDLGKTINNFVSCNYYPIWKWYSTVESGKRLAGRCRPPVAAIIVRSFGRIPTTFYNHLKLLLIRFKWFYTASIFHSRLVFSQQSAAPSHLYDAMASLLPFRAVHELGVVSLSPK